MAKSQATKAALQEQTVANLAKQISALTDQVAAGFKGVHERQDTTNGRISKGETELALMKQQIENDKKLAAEQSKNRVRPWQVLTILLPIIVGLASYIIYSH